MFHFTENYSPIEHRKHYDDITLTLLHTKRAHQQPITVVMSDAGRIVTASQDHTLKV